MDTKANDTFMGGECGINRPGETVKKSLREFIKGRQGNQLM